MLEVIEIYKIQFNQNSKPVITLKNKAQKTIIEVYKVGTEHNVKRVKMNFNTNKKKFNICIFGGKF